MATGRTLMKWARFYAGGYDLSGMGRKIGPLDWNSEEADLTAPMGDSVKGSLPFKESITCHNYNAVLQSTTDSGVEVSRLQVAGSGRDIMIPIGIQAAPAIGDWVFICKPSQSEFTVSDEGGGMVINGTFGEWDASDMPQAYSPWGLLLHANGAETAANSGTTDTVTAAARTTAGGYMAYQVLGGDATVTLTVQHSVDNVNANFVDLGGCTANVEGTAPSAGIVYTTLPTTEVERYTRWQVNILYGTSLTFALAFVRG